MAELIHGDLAYPCAYAAKGFALKDRVADKVSEAWETFSDYEN
jgi:hypothetical protein